MDLKLFDTLTFITFQNMLRLSPLCTWEIFRRYSWGNLTIDNPFGRYCEQALEISRPGKYFDKTSSMYPLKTMGTENSTYGQTSILLYEDLKLYEKKLIPLIWSESSIVLTQIEGIDFNYTGGNPNFFKLKRSHPFYDFYHKDGKPIEFNIRNYILEEIIKHEQKTKT